MRRIILNIILVLLIANITAQTPEGFRFQAVLRNPQNIPLSEQSVVVKISIIENAINGNEVYSEEHSIVTSRSGIVNLIIGQGVTNDVFSSIDWSNGPYYTKLYIDNELFSTTQLLSVPFAMHAKTAESVNSFGVSSTGDTLSINGDKYVVPGLSGKNKTKYSDQVCLGGSKNETLISSIVNNDGSILLGCISQSFNGDITDGYGADDIWIVKLNADKTIAWQKSIGGSKYETLYKIITNENGGCYFAGTSESTNGDITSPKGNFDIIIGEVTADGQLSWIKSFGGGNAEFINSFKKTSDNGFLIGATTFSLGGDVLVNNGDADIWIMKLNSSKGIEWQKSLGGLRYDALAHLEELPNNEYLVVGSTESNGGDINGNNGAMDFWLGKLSSDRSVSQQICIGDVTNDNVNLVDYSNGNVLAAGVTFSSNWDAYSSQQTKNLKLVSFNASNLIQFTDKQIGGRYAEDVKQILKTNTGYVVLAETESFDGDINNNNGDKDIWLLELDNNLNIVKNVCIGGSYAEGSCIIKATNDGYIVAGTSLSNDGDLAVNNGKTDIWLVKLNSDFSINKQKVIGGSETEMVTDILVHDSTNKITILGSTSSNDYGISGLHGQPGKNSDVWAVTVNL